MVNTQRTFLHTTTPENDGNLDITIVHYQTTKSLCYVNEKMQRNHDIKETWSDPDYNTYIKTGPIKGKIEVILMFLMTWTFLN